MDVKKFINKNKDKIIEDIATLVEIPTVYSEGTEGKPFGDSIAEGLDTVLEMGRKMGMQAKNIDGYAGEITAGTGNQTIGVLAHIDVVPAGTDWNTEPFKCKNKDGKLYGRGTMDDKGPLVAGLYAMKYLMDNNKIPKDSAVKLIIGADEEEEWRCMKYYKEHVHPLPEYSIVPDGYFPLIFCEKGLIDFDLSQEFYNDKAAVVKVVEITGGTSRNIVPASAMCKLLVDGEAKKALINHLKQFQEIECLEIENGLKLNVTGKSTHAMSPEKGLNAVSLLMEALGKVKEPVSNRGFIETYNKYIGMNYNGERFGCGFNDELSGRLTLNVGTISLKENYVSMEMNLRYPASTKWETVKEAMMKTIKEAGFSYKEKSYLPPVYIDPDSDFVQGLMDSYRRITGDMENQPFAIGGATYARGIPNAVAFGPLFPDEEELAHEANEFISIRSLEKMTEIYVDALERLLRRY